MTAARPERFARVRVAQWAIWQSPRPLTGYIVAADTVALVILALTVPTVTFGASSAMRFGVLVALAIFYGEIAAKASRLQFKLGQDLRLDMTSAWTIPAAVVLPVAWTALFITLIQSFDWLRRGRAAGDQPHRALVSFAMILPAGVAANAVFAELVRAMSGHTTGWAGAIGVVGAAATFTLVNRGLVTIFLVLLGVRGRGLIGSWEDNALELATLCLGGLTAVALRFNPALSILVLLPLALLQRAALVKQLEEAATTDVKTGLLNAITWEQLAMRELARAERDGTPTSVMIIDLDHFKAVNDVFGHLAGDAALKEIGAILRSELRGYDTVGRFGGEEFVAVMPTTDEAHAAVVAERVRERISLLHMSEIVVVAEDAEDRVLTVSIGVSCAPGHGTEVAELLHVADAALYRAKNGGRNRVVLASDDGTAGERESVTA